MASIYIAIQSPALHYFNNNIHAFSLCRYGDGYILVGFEAGFFIAISTHIKEVGQELFQVKNHRDSLTDIALSQAVGKVATCGDNTIKVHSLQNLEETETLISVTSENGVRNIEWSTDGTMLAVVTYIGNILIYLIEIPKLTSVCGNRIALLTSLMEVAVHLYTLDKVFLITRDDTTGFLFTRNHSSRINLVRK